VVIGLRARKAKGVRNDFHGTGRFTAKAQRSLRSLRGAKLRREVVDETFDAVGEEDIVKIDEKSELFVGHSQVGENLGGVDG
jgi:hypothetical protein